MDVLKSCSLHQDDASDFEYLLAWKNKLWISTATTVTGIIALGRTVAWSVFLFGTFSDDDHGNALGDCDNHTQHLVF